MMTNVDPESPIVIVGAGCFGLSTAYHLLKRGFTNVTVLDRAEVLPAKDAASTDLNKIVRSSYPDDFYTSLAQEAVKAWKDEGEWGKHYHETGVLIMGERTAGYTTASYANDLALGVRVSILEDEESRRSIFDSGVGLGTAFTRKGCFAYLNLDAGWVYAEGGTRRALENVRALGGAVVAAKEVKALVRENGDTGRTTGVRCTDGTVYSAALVILATGSWTPSTFPGVISQSQCLATGHSVVTIELTPEEGNLYRNVPVIYNQTAGFYVFPPNAENIVKMSIHDGGHTRNIQTDHGIISAPRTVLTHGDAEGCRIPVESAKELRKGFQEIYPELASSKPFVTTRVCWYTDTQDDDWLIGPVPGDPSLFVATGGNGHAYKFLPVIGRLVVDAIQGLLPEHLVKKFAIDRQQLPTDNDVRESVLPIERRMDTTRRLDESSLSTDKDLLPP